MIRAFGAVALYLGILRRRSVGIQVLGLRWCLISLVPVL